MKRCVRDKTKCVTTLIIKRFESGDGGIFDYFLTILKIFEDNFPHISSFLLISICGKHSACFLFRYLCNMAELFCSIQGDLGDVSRINLIHIGSVN